MTTQLASQLAALAAKAGLDKTKRPKGQPSLLYEPHEAADISSEDVFDVALQGTAHELDSPAFVALNEETVMSVCSFSTVRPSILR
jgi:hypothetical protein